MHALAFASKCGFRGAIGLENSSPSKPSSSNIDDKATPPSPLAEVAIKSRRVFAKFTCRFIFMWGLFARDELVKIQQHPRSGCPSAGLCIAVKGLGLVFMGGVIGACLFQEIDQRGAFIG